MQTNPGRSREGSLQDFVDWSAAHIKGDEKGEAQIFLDHLFRAFGQKGSLDVGGTVENCSQAPTSKPAVERTVHTSRWQSLSSFVFVAVATFGLMPRQ
jgi:hypothetical protein